MFKRLFYPLLFLKPLRLFTPSMTRFATAKILNPHDIPMKAYTELTWAIAACHNCKMMADLLKTNLSQMSDYQLSLAIYWIYNYDLELDENFYSTILPIVKEFVKNMNKEHNRTFAEIVSYMGWMKVQDDSLWTLFEHKLITDRLYRYLSLEQLIDVTSGISSANKGNPALFDTFEKVFIKHRLALNEDRAETIRKAFEDKKLGSNLLFKVLENPRGEIAELKEEKKAIGHH